MLHRRSLLAAFSFFTVSACARAQASQQPAVNAGDMAGLAGAALTELTGSAGNVVWLSLSGSVRLIAGNANVRQATLLRAIMTLPDGNSARIFDIWQIDNDAAFAAPSVTRDAGAGAADTGRNDAGVDSVWLRRSFTHPALQAPIEESRLSRTGARVMVIDATQIWLVEGGISVNAPVLTGTALATYEAWQKT